MKHSLRLSVSLAVLGYLTGTTHALAADVLVAAMGIEEVLVSATKRQTNLQETPISMSVMNNEELDKRHVMSLINLADGAIPSLRVATFEARQSALTIGMRGIVPLDANQPAREQGVGVYIDGVYLGRQHGLNASLLDIQQIEVLKGPQGTLFGRNTEGGAVNLITRAPSGVFEGRLVSSVGNYGSYSQSAHLDMPKIGDLSIKVDGILEHQDATVTNPLPGSVGWNYANRRGGRISARWEPADNFIADFSYDIGRDENTPFYSQLINYNPRGLSVLPLNQPAGTIPAGTIRALPSSVVVAPSRVDQADIGVPQQVTLDETEGGMMYLRWKFDSVELRSISAYRTISDDQWDNSGGAHRTPVYVTNGAFSRYSLSQLNQHQFSQEFQAVGGFDNIDYVAGLYYFTEGAGDAAATPNTNQWNADGTGYTILDPRLTIPGFRSIDRASNAQAKSLAAYGQATWTPAAMEQLHLTIGARQTKDNKSGLLYKVNNAATDFVFDLSSNHFDPLVTLAYDATRDVHLYAKYASGYRSGGASSRSLTYRSFDPETVKSYEIGAKTEMFNRMLRLNVAAYKMDRTGSQIDFNFFDPITNRNTLETVNAPGTTKINGVEIEASAYLTDGLSVSASYTYTDAKVPETPNPLLAGNPIQAVFIVFTPPNAASVALDYTVPQGTAELRFHLDGNYSDAVYSFDNENVKTDSALIFNARVSLAEIPLGKSDSRLSLSAWARNVFNNDYIYRRSNANGAALGDYANFNAPRTFGVEALVSF
ncbi:MAG: TonB-dependent receptor [Pseudomonadales bacterium]|jgi:iron complex outermembrane receptor protein|nr:TonB-dependent receptor [Pseudomonadales bacterium]